MSSRDDSTPTTDEPSGGDNRPGLDQIDYRVGTHASFMERMLARIHRQHVPPDEPPEPGHDRPLRALRTRRRDDPAIALIDAWATCADVLTFYQERLANEQYLRTARERRSVVELAALVGYRPDPGVSASARLAFRVDDSDQGPARAEVPAGTQVQSVPERGELPRTFETAHALVARPEWNEIGARQTRPQYLALGTNIGSEDTDKIEAKLYLVDSDGTLRAGPESTQEQLPTKQLEDLYFLGADLPHSRDASSVDVDAVRVKEVDTVYFEGGHDDLRVGDPIVLVGTRMESFEDDNTYLVIAARIEEVQAEPKRRRTRVRLDLDPSEDDKSGKAASNTGSLTSAHFADGLAIEVATTPVDELAYVAPVASRTDLQMKVWLRAQGVVLAEAAAAARQQIEDSGGDAKRGLFGFDKRVGFFGNNAPSSAALEQTYGSGTLPDNWESASVWDIPPRLGSTTGDKSGPFLERIVDAVEPGQWTVFSQEGQYFPYWIEDTVEESIRGFSISARATGLTLKEVTGGPGTLESADSGSALKVSSATAHVDSRSMGLAELAMPEHLGKTRATDGGVEMVGESRLALDGLYMGLSKGKEVIVGGEKLHPPGVIGHEVAELAEVVHTGAHTVLYLSEALDNAYRRDTLRVQANVAAATHGKSVTEVLGSGDASRKNQTFELRQPPLTYVPTADGSGSRSTLEIRVDRVRWPQVDAFEELGPDEHGYIVRFDEDGAAHVTFGDGVHGARLPTGRENVVARYRSGTGLNGEVGAERLSILKQRPAGIRTVTNPVRAGGGADPESRDDTRVNAPRDTRLLERIVSLEDYADFARNWGGIEKARVDLLSRAGRTAVYLTVGGTGPDSLNDTRIEELREGIAQSSSGRYAVEIARLEPMRFGLDAQVLLADGHLADEVLQRVRARLQSRYAYQARGFLEPVSAAQITTEIQGIDGVSAVRLRQLFEVPGSGLARNLSPRGARFRSSDGHFQPAQMLWIEPDAIKLSEM